MKKIHNPQQILTLIRNHYENLHSFSCNRARAYFGVFSNPEPVKFKQPNKVKDYGSPLTVCDGKNEFVYNDLEKIVWITPVSEKEDLLTRLLRTRIAAFSFLFMEEFEIATVLEDDKKYHLKFKDKLSGELVGGVEVDKTSLHLSYYWIESSEEMTPEGIIEGLKNQGAIEGNDEESQKIIKFLQEEFYKEFYKEFPHLQGQPLVAKIEERYSDWQENIQIEDSEFEFTIPEGVEIKKVERIGCDILCKDLLLKKLK